LEDDPGAPPLPAETVTSLDALDVVLALLSPPELDVLEVLAACDSLDEEGALLLLAAAPPIPSEAAKGSPPHASSTKIGAIPHEMRAIEDKEQSGKRMAASLAPLFTAGARRGMVTPS